MERCVPVGCDAWCCNVCHQFWARLRWLFHVGRNILSDLTQAECPECGASFTRSPELTVCTKCGARIRGSWSRSRLPLVVWIVWAVLPAALVLFGTLLERRFKIDSSELLMLAIFGGPIVLYVWGVALLKSPKHGALTTYLLAVPLAAVMYTINFWIAFAGCSMAGELRGF